GVRELLNERSARGIYEETSALLQEDRYSVKNLLRGFNVKKLCTTEDPADSLEYHRSIQESGFEIKVSTAWRPDNALDVRDARKFNDYLDGLSAASDREIATFSDYLDALQQRHDFFHEMGCR